MAEAQFYPGAAPSAIPNAMNTGLATGVSMMDRASRRRMDEENHAMRMQEEELLRPAKEAQARATVAKARNTIAGLEQSEAMRAAAHDEFPSIREEFSAALSNDDASEREVALGKALGRATKYEMVSELKPEVDRMKEVWSAAHITARTLANAKEISTRQTDIAETKVNAAAERQAAEAELKKQLADQKAEADRLKQQLVNAGKKDVATTRAGGQYEHLLSSYQAAVEAGDEETATLLDAQIKKRNHIAQPYSDAERIKTLDAEAKAAEADGDAALAKSLRDRIGYLTKRGGGAAKTDPFAAALEHLGIKDDGQQKPSPTVSSKPVAPSKIDLSKIKL